MKSQKLSLNLQELTTDASNLFNELVNKHEFNFLKQVSEDKDKLTNEILAQLVGDCELDVLPTLEFRNDITGVTFDAHVCVVSSTRILVISRDSEIRFELKFTDLASLEDQLILLNEMEEYLVETN